MKSNKTEPTDPAKHDEDLSLFHDAMQGVQPLEKANKVVHERKATPPATQYITQEKASIPEDTLSDHISLEIADGEEWSFLSPGVSRQTLRRLRRGYWGIQAIWICTDLTAMKHVWNWYRFWIPAGMRVCVVSASYTARD